MAVFPGAIPTFDGFSPNNTLAQDHHAAQHNLEQAEIINIATKLGTGASTPVAGTVLRGKAGGESAWEPINVEEDFVGVLPVARGGTGVDTLAELIEETPHDHQTPQTGGVLSGAALTATDGLYRTSRYYTADDTWAKPAGLKFIVVEVQAGGASGAGTAATTAAQFSVSAGGGGGGYSRKKIDAASLADTEAVTVGIGGTGVSAAVGNAGGNSSFGAHATAAGGAVGTTSGAVANTAGAAVNGGLGGSGTGDLVVPGGAGGVGSVFISHNNVGYGGYGGGSHLGSGGMPRFANYSGLAAVGYGGGGAGAAKSTSQAATAGGSGTAGIVIVHEYF